GPRTFETPPEWNAYTGHYRNENAWEGSFRIFLHKGRLSAGGDPLVPLGPGLFRFGEEEHNPDRIRFEEVVNGKALRAVISGTEYQRIET
ncbi:MAG TPA: serine hydrolase, partial [Thermoanaerobaculia bacterium]|nr:serine hydrolase [Thermoanaerobaculia bacterium]